MYLEECGVCLTDSGDVAAIYGVTNDDGDFSLYYNNEPYGIVSLSGFRDLQIVPTQSCGLTQEVLASALIGKVRGRDVTCIITLKAGLLILKGEYKHNAFIQDFKYIDDGEQYHGYFDISDIEDDDECYEELCEVMGII